MYKPTDVLSPSSDPNLPSIADGLASHGMMSEIPSPRDSEAASHYYPIARTLDGDSYNPSAESDTF